MNINGIIDIFNKNNSIIKGLIFDILKKLGIYLKP